MRLFRLMKLFRHVEKRPGDAAAGSGSQRHSRLSLIGPSVKQSHVGQQLSELTTRRVVLGVLTMVLVLPYWDVTNSVYGSAPDYSAGGLASLHRQALAGGADSALLQSALAVRRSARGPRRPYFPLAPSAGDSAG